MSPLSTATPIRPTPSDQAAPWELLIIGSGFGGATVAARVGIHRPDWRGRVAVLEHGEEDDGLRPSTPEQPQGTANGFRLGRLEFCMPTAPLPPAGRRNYLVLRGRGLGGGSLVYLNVRERPKDVIFDLLDGGARLWPDSIRLPTMAPYYDAADLGVQAGKQPPWERPGRFRALPWAPGNPSPAVQELNLAVTPHAAPSGCAGEGACERGCPTPPGARHVLTRNLLAVAAGAGVALHCRHEVIEVRSATGGGFEVHVSVDGTAVVAVAKRVVLAAGVMGTNALLLRSKGQLRGGASWSTAQTRVGQRVSANGDIPSASVPTPAGWNLAGPSITTALDFSARWPVTPTQWKGRGVLIEDMGTHRIGDVPLHVLCQYFGTQQGTPWSDLQGEGLAGSDDASPGAQANRLYLLGMALDAADGQVTMLGPPNKKRPVFRMSDGPSDPVRRNIRRAIGELAVSLGFRVTDARGPLRRYGLVDAPAWGTFLGVTAHPLGGAVLSTSPSRGVTDPIGRVWGLDGLYVADASLIPGPLGINPALTVSALAERVSWFLVHGAGHQEMVRADLPTWARTAP